MDEKETDEVVLYDGPFIDCEELGRSTENRRSIFPDHFTYPKCSRVLRDLGIEKLEEEAGPYKVDASASKKEIEVKYLESDELDADDYSVEEILFEGGLVIYEERESEDAGQIDAVWEQGKIWKSFEDIDKFKGDGALEKLIFCESPHEEEKISRIEAIAQGFKDLREKKEKRKRKLQMSSYEQGKRDGMPTRGP
ncbi:MAG: hypothetical protein ACLFQ8_03505 [Candidatus Aenigmatarchaeota archaeon]